MEITESPFTQIIQDVTANAKYITPELQKAIAQYISYQSTPPIIKSGKIEDDGLNYLRDYKKGKAK